MNAAQPQATDRLGRIVQVTGMWLCCAGVFLAAALFGVIQVYSQNSNTAGESSVLRSNADVAPCLTVVIPVYNEAATVSRVITNVLQQRPVQQVVVVDDGSIDGTWAVLEQSAAADPRLCVVRHPRNFGKGMAVRTGFARASAPFVMVQDADLEYDPAEYYLLLGPLVSGKADAVYGSRFLGAGAHRVLYFWHSLGNKVLTLLSNMATDLNLTDVETCFKAFRRELLQSIELMEPRFGFEIEITAKLSRLGARIYEVPISYHGRTYREGKKANWRDGLSALRCILKYNIIDRVIGRGNLVK